MQALLRQGRNACTAPSLSTWTSGRSTLRLISSQSIKQVGVVCREMVRASLCRRVSFPSSTELISTTTADPTRPRKNITSSTRIAKMANTMQSILTQPDVLHSTLYAIHVETVGCRGTFRRLARVCRFRSLARSLPGARFLRGSRWRRCFGRYCPCRVPRTPKRVNPSPPRRFAVDS